MLIAYTLITIVLVVLLKLEERKNNSLYMKNQAQEVLIAAYYVKLKNNSLELSNEEILIETENFNRRNK